MQIANVTATYDGEQVEDHDDVTRGAFSSLLHSGDEIVIHEVHDQDQVGDLEERYTDDWEEKVTVKTSAEGDEGDEAEQEEDQNVAGDDDNECRHVDCDGDANMVAHCDTGQKKHYCHEHAGGARAGHALVETWEEL